MPPSRFGLKRRAPSYCGRALCRRRDVPPASPIMIPMCPAGPAGPWRARRAQPRARVLALPSPRARQLRPVAHPRATRGLAPGHVCPPSQSTLCALFGASHHLRFAPLFPAPRSDGYTCTRCAGAEDCGRPRYSSLGPSRSRYVTSWAVMLWISALVLRISPRSGAYRSYMES